MTELDITAKVEALRKELRDGRVSEASRTGEDTERHVSVSPDSQQRTSRKLRSNDKSNVRDVRSPDSLIRGLDSFAVGSGLGSRRPGESNSSPDSVENDVGRSNEPAPRNTRLIRNDEVRQRKTANEDGEETQIVPRVVVPRGPGRPRKDSGSQETRTPAPAIGSIPQRPTNTGTIPFIKPGKSNTLSQIEANAIKEPFKAALNDDFTYVDQLINHTTGNEQPIWSDIDEDELNKLVSFGLKQGQRNAIAAGTVRGITEGSEYLALGAILAPRIQKTVSVLNAHRQIQKSLPSLRKNRLQSIREEIGKHEA